MASGPFDILIRKTNYSEEEDMYNITVFEKLESMEELFNYAEVNEIVAQNVIRMEKVDSYRFRLFVQK